MKTVKYYAMETVCSEATLCITDEEHKNLLSMSKKDAANWLAGADCDYCDTVECIGSELPHLWLDGYENEHDLEE